MTAGLHAFPFHCASLSVVLSQGSSGQAEKVKQVLEHRIKELEDIIQKRFPNSLSALIVASKINTCKLSVGQVRIE